jgi:hypothetical protein
MAKGSGYHRKDMAKNHDKLPVVPEDIEGA